jgi:sugar lactone lactonase YvrE
MRAPGRVLTVALATVALGAGLVAPATAQPSHHRDHHPTRIDLPKGFQPEGITVGRNGRAYLGSLATGDIYSVSLRTGQGRVISTGPQTPPSVGLKIDQHGRLFVSGGPTGTGRLVSTATGRVLATYEFTSNNSFINDVVLTKRSAWFTDSFQAQLYAVARPRHGRVSTAVRTLTLTGDWKQDETPGVFNANGIAQTPDHRALLVVQSNTGLLFRIDPRTGAAKKVDLGGTLLLGGDGLLVRGRTLIVVQGSSNAVALVRLNARGTAGAKVASLTSPDFDTPTTVAAYRGSLYLPNARFTVANPTTADFWITRVRP